MSTNCLQAFCLSATKRANFIDLKISRSSKFFEIFQVFDGLIYHRDFHKIVGGFLRLCIISRRRRFLGTFLDDGKILMIFLGSCEMFEIFKIFGIFNILKHVLRLCTCFLEWLASRV